MVDLGTLGAFVGVGWLACAVACGPGKVEFQNDSGETGSDGHEDSGTHTTQNTGSTGSTSGGSDGDGENDGTDGPKFDFLIPDAPILDPDCIPEEVESACPWDVVQSTSIEGDSPAGPLSMVRAHFGGARGCGGCVHREMVQLVLFPEGADLPMDGDWEQQDRLVVYFGVSPDQLVDPQAGLELYIGGSEYFTTGTISFEGLPSDAEWNNPAPQDVPISVSGTISADQDGWSLSGSFEATYCGLTAAFGGCGE